MALEEALEPIAREKDALGMAIRGHKLLDSQLTRLLSEALPGEHGLELGRQSFLLKLDLCVGLELIPARDAPVMRKINWLRNKLAHEHGFEFDEPIAKDLWNTLNPEQQDGTGRTLDDCKEPIRALQSALVVAAFGLQHAFLHAVHKKVHGEVWKERVDDLLERIDGRSADPKPTPQNDDFKDEVRRRVRERFPDDL